jgi:hypothetical protein
VAGSGQRSGVPVEGGSDGVVASSRAVLWLEAEAREGTASAASEREKKHSAGEKHPFKGGAPGTQRRGNEASRATRGGARGEGGLAPTGGGQLMRHDTAGRGRRRVTD